MQLIRVWYPCQLSLASDCSTHEWLFGTPSLITVSYGINLPTSLRREWSYGLQSITIWPSNKEMLYEHSNVKIDGYYIVITIVECNTRKYHEFIAEYCYECEAQVTIPMAMNEWCFLGIAFYYGNNDFIVTIAVFCIKYWSHDSNTQWYGSHDSNRGDNSFYQNVFTFTFSILVYVNEYTIRYVYLICLPCTCN